MTQPYLGEIRAVGFNFAPRGWMFCAGQILPIQQFQALFSLLGTNYGGNGTSNFALPDLRGRAAIGQGQGPGLSNVIVGEQGGVESVTLLTSQIPSHTHGVGGASGAETTNRPTGAYQAAGNSYSTSRDVSMAPTDVAGSSLPHENRQPYLGINYIIAVEGIFPSRN